MKTHLSHIAAGFVAALLLGGALPSAARQLVKQEVAGVRNFTRVDATVACGGATEVAAIPELKREGFVAIINLRLFIHCASGGRAAAMWLIKRVLRDGWSIDDATKEAEVIGLQGGALRDFAIKYIEAHRNDR